MKTKQKLTIALLLLGLILSSMIRIRFNISNGFEFHNFWINIIPLPLSDYCGESSPELFLTSTILGYFIFILSGLFMLRNLKWDKFNVLNKIGFLVFAICATVPELTSIIQDLNSEFMGQHLRAGPILFIAGLIIFIKDYRMVSSARHRRVR